MQNGGWCRVRGEKPSDPGTSGKEPNSLTPKPPTDRQPGNGVSGLKASYGAVTMTRGSCVRARRPSR
jgi:hypothetical protein